LSIITIKDADSQLMALHKSVPGLLSGCLNFGQHAWRPVLTRTQNILHRVYNKFSTGAVENPTAGSAGSLCSALLTVLRQQEKFALFFIAFSFQFHYS